MRVVVLTNPQSNQNALISKIAERVDVAAVVYSRNIPRKKASFGSRFRGTMNSISGRTFGRELIAAWNGMLARYEETYQRYNESKSIEVDNVNDEATRNVLTEISPDLVVVSGTNIVGKKLIEHAQDFGRIVNLHTGISPYVKGGPNCTNWCLAKNWFHLIGNSVMWLDAGVDSGALIATERTDLNGSETLTELQWKVMEHAHEMYVSSIAQLCKGRELSRVPQSSIAAGTEFRSFEWTNREMQNALSNFRTKYRSFFARDDKGEVFDEVKLLPLKRD